MRPPSSQNLDVFFNEWTGLLRKASKKYKNFILMIGFNFDVGLSYAENDQVEECSSLFNSKILINKGTYFTNNHKSFADLISANKPNSFQNSSIIETGGSDYHKLVGTFFKLHFNRLLSKTVY